MNPKTLGRIITPWNRPPGRTERRVLVNGRWRRPDPVAAQTLAWLRGQTTTAAVAR